MRLSKLQKTTLKCLDRLEREERDRLERLNPELKKMFDIQYDGVKVTVLMAAVYNYYKRGLNRWLAGQTERVRNDLTTMDEGSLKKEYQQEMILRTHQLAPMFRLTQEQFADDFASFEKWKAYRVRSVVDGVGSLHFEMFKVSMFRSLANLLGKGWIDKCWIGRGRWKMTITGQKIIDG